VGMRFVRHYWGRETSPEYERAKLDADRLTVLVCENHVWLLNPRQDMLSVTVRSLYPLRALAKIEGGKVGETLQPTATVLGTGGIEMLQKQNRRPLMV
jgi:hypothetical protein